MEFKKIVITKFGGPEVLKMITEPSLPEPKPGEVRVKVLCTSAAFTDTLIRRGNYLGIKVKPPFSPGYDLIGIVDKVGAGVTHIKKGQKIAELTVIGAYSQYICLNAKTVVPVPDGLKNEEAVSLILTYLTAYQMLHRSAKVKEGQTILIHACSGAVGTAMLQLGKLMNLKMYGTASKGKHDFIQAEGGIPIDYQHEDFLERLKKDEPNGIDAVFDPIGGDYFPRSLKVLKKRGTLVGFGYQSAASGNGGNVILDFMKVKFWNLLPTKPNANFYIISDWHQKQNDWFKADMQALFNLLATHKIRPEIGKIMDFSQAAEAHKLVESAAIIGKIVLTVNKEA
ncbi:medium chain dehydrogenase/reductase family protein [Crocinitomix catalasitica]|uniref:medium chain dehydrogenase/reductase family protein n=1 Tax=Crocinitomix catalasitica TaxID=184607 RepID=UPI0004848459|nr:medium chain dehydrogenase/reductase family protein [Crocinitomix catalasitica]